MFTPLFLLGAGFNYDARKLAGTIIGKSIYIGKYEIDCEYPLLNDLYKTCFPNKEVDPSISIEKLFNDSIKNHNFEPIRLLYEKIMKADYYQIPKLFSNQSNCYMNFFRKFKESSFLTFNYDSLTELFLLKLDQWYPHDGYGVNVEVAHRWDIEIDKIKKEKYLEKISKSLVLHLHGSLSIYIKDFEIENNLLKLKDNPIFKFDPHSIANLFHPYEKAPLDATYKPNIEYRVIAPVPDKTEGLKNDFIMQMYSKAKDLLTDSKLLVAIGYNFSEHDKNSYHNLLYNWEGVVLIISPNANELKNRLVKEYPKIKWRSVSTSFKNWVDNKFEGLN